MYFNTRTLHCKEVENIYFFFWHTFTKVKYSLLPNYDGCEVSTRPSFFDSDLPCFWIGPSLFWFSPSHLLSQSFPFFSQTFRVLTQTFSFFWVGYSLFWLSPSHLLSQSFRFLTWTFRFLTQSFSVFLSQTYFILTQSFSFIESVLPIFESYLPCFESVLLVFLSWTFSILTQSFPYIESILPIFSTASFPLLPALHSDLIPMCTVDKINDGGVCRKRLLHNLERKIQIVLPENLVKKILRDKKKERKLK